MNDLLYMEVDFRIVKANIEEIRKSSEKEVIPVIKSNAYSMGDIEFAKYLEEIGIEYLAVVDEFEALRLLENNISISILLLNSLQKDSLKYLNQYPNLVVSVNSVDDIVDMDAFPLFRQVKVHIQIDTGMNRLGFKDKNEYLKALSIIKKNKNLVLEGIYTHFTGPENRINQETIFKDYLDQYPYKMIHCAATSTYHQTRIGNYVRVGLNLYGDIRENGKQCLKVACRPLRIFMLKKGETIGYNQDYTAEEDSMVAVLPIGYFNGFRRSLRGFPVMANHKRYETIGKVCMNHLFVKVDETITMDTEFVITSVELPISELADYLHTIPHEILCMMNIPNKYYIK